METKIKDLKAGDSFRTLSGAKEYKIEDVVFRSNCNQKVWLLKGGWYIQKENKIVIKL
jgi:hypothetical protein